MKTGKRTRQLLDVVEVGIDGRSRVPSKLLAQIPTECHPNVHIPQEFDQRPLCEDDTRVVPVHHACQDGLRRDV